MIPGIVAFFLASVDHQIDDVGLYGGNKAKRAVFRILMKYLCKAEKNMLDAAAACGKFIVPSPYYEMKEHARGLIGFGCKMGEGWLLTAEMNELIELGYDNIVCIQPFGCLPNHIVGKGMIRKLKNLYPDSNIVPVDYDPGATKVNQENRIKLMLAVAAEKLRGEPDSAEEEEILAEPPSPPFPPTRRIIKSSTPTAAA